MKTREKMTLPIRTILFSYLIPITPNPYTSPSPLFLSNTVMCLSLEDVQTYPLNYPLLVLAPKHFFSYITSHNHHLYP